VAEPRGGPSARAIVRLFGVTMAGLALCYGALAAFRALWNPTIDLDDLRAGVAAALGGEVKVGAGTLDVARGRADLDDVTVALARPGVRRAELHADEVHVDVTMASLAGDALVLDAVTLVRPSVTYVREGPAPPEPGTGEPGAAAPPALLVRRLDVTGGRFSFEDRTMLPDGPSVTLRLDGVDVHGHDLSPRYPLSLLCRVAVTGGALTIDSTHRGAPHAGPDGALGGGDHATLHGIDLRPLAALSAPLPVKVKGTSAELEIDAAPPRGDEVTLSGRIAAHGLGLEVPAGGVLGRLLGARLSPLAAHLARTGGELDLPFSVDLDLDDLRGYLGDVVRAVALRVGMDLLRRLPPAPESAPASAPAVAPASATAAAAAAAAAAPVPASRPTAPSP
jgi:hypothetical protein